MSTIINAQNTTQDLFTITFPTPRVPLIRSVGSSAVLTFDTVIINEDSLAQLNGSTGQITVASTSTLVQVSVSALTASQEDIFLKLERTDSGLQIGQAQPITRGLTVVFQPESTGDYQVVAYTLNGSAFAYPDQITQAEIVIETVDQPVDLLGCSQMPVLTAEPAYASTATGAMCVSDPASWNPAGIIGDLSLNVYTGSQWAGVGLIAGPSPL